MYIDIFRLLRLPVLLLSLIVLQLLLLLVLLLQSSKYDKLSNLYSGINIIMISVGINNKSRSRSEVNAPRSEVGGGPCGTPRGISGDTSGKTSGRSVGDGILDACRRNASPTGSPGVLPEDLRECRFRFKCGRQEHFELERSSRTYSKRPHGACRRSPRPPPTDEH